MLVAALLLLALGLVVAFLVHRHRGTAPVPVVAPGVSVVAAPARPSPDARWQEEAGALAAALLPEPGAPVDPDALRGVLARAMADSWATGVNELRDAMLTSSGLSSALVDDAITCALRALEARRS